MCFCVFCRVSYFAGGLVVVCLLLIPAYLVLFFSEHYAQKTFGMNPRYSSLKFNAVCLSNTDQCKLKTVTEITKEMYLESEFFKMNAAGFSPEQIGRTNLTHWADAFEAEKINRMLDMLLINQSFCLCSIWWMKSKREQKCKCICRLQFVHCVLLSHQQHFISLNLTPNSFIVVR